VNGDIDLEREKERLSANGEWEIVMLFIDRNRGAKRCEGEA